MIAVTLLEMTFAVETRNLTHRFGDSLALRDVSLQVPEGSIYGFLGPNGAGKTTTLRLVLGLLRRQHGSIDVFGRPFERHRLDILRRVGASIETPSLYGQLTAVENLEVWRRIFRCPRRRIDEVLVMVGLESTGSKRADQFSLGMKQRLGIAIALLHDPPLLILDEPANGLDPHGILDMRALLTRLNRECGVTILVSSHLLVEIERLATHVGVINRGALTFQGTLAALLSRRSQSAVTTLDTSDNPRTVALASRLGMAARVERERVIVPALIREDAGRLTSLLASSGIVLYEIVTARQDLEHVFLDLIGDTE